MGKKWKKKKKRIEKNVKKKEKEKKRTIFAFWGQNGKISYIEFFKPNRRCKAAVGTTGIFYNIHRPFCSIKGSFRDM